MVAALTGRRTLEPCQRLGVVCAGEQIHELDRPELEPRGGKRGRIPGE